MTKVIKFYLIMIAIGIVGFLVVAAKLDITLTKIDFQGLKWGIFCLCFAQGCAILGIIAEYVFIDLDKERKGE